MSITGVFIFLVFLIILVVAGIYFFNSATKSGFIDGFPVKKLSAAQQQSNIAYNAYLPTPVWSAFTPNTSPDGRCLAYSAVSSQFVPVGATYTNLNNSGGRGFIASNQNCIDADQIFAQAGSHVCLLNNSGSAGSGCFLTVPTLINGVVTPPGTKVERGTIEGVYEDVAGTTPYYANCNYPNSAATISPNSNPGSFCGGNIGLISLDFTPIQNIDLPESLCSGGNNRINYCLSLDNSEDAAKNKRFFDVSFESCDLGQIEQLFRIVRYSIDANFNITQNNTGNLASIVYRQNGYYLAPDLVYDFEQKQYIFDYLIKDGVISTLAGQDTVRLKLINPKDDTVRNGVYWLLQDQLADPSYELDTVPPQQYFGCNIFEVSLGTAINNCSVFGLPSFYQPTSFFTTSYPAKAPVSPQQIVYIPNIYQLPFNIQDITGYWTYLSNQYSINLVFSSADTNKTVPLISGLQEFRKNIPVTITTRDCDNGFLGAKCVANYTPNSFPIKADPNLPYPDTQFLEYTNMPEAIKLGVGPLTPGCQITDIITFFAGNTYNPIVPENNILIFAPANTNSALG
jgi:hypothetical protein